MNGVRTAGGLAAAAVLAWLVLGGMPAGAETPPDPALHDEDVVRMLVAGKTVEEVVEVIRTRPVDFDLSEEMLVELRTAGVPAAVLQAMKERQKELHPPKPEPAAEDTRESGAILTILLAPDEETSKDHDARALYFPRTLSPDAAEQLQLDKSKPPVVEHLALFLACRTAVHVPDQWRSKSPLGRDFVSMPRHRLLAFVPGGQAVPAKNVPRKFRTALRGLRRRDSEDDTWIRMELPDKVEATLTPGEPHDLVLGVAIEVAGRYLRVASVNRDAVEVPDSGLELRARATSTAGKDGIGFEVSLVDK